MSDNQPHNEIEWSIDMQETDWPKAKGFDAGPPALSAQSDLYRYLLMIHKTSLSQSMIEMLSVILT